MLFSEFEKSQEELKTFIIGISNYVDITGKEKEHFERNFHIFYAKEGQDFSEAHKKNQELFLDFV